LHNGDRLTQVEFHRRYLAMPAGTKAELIGGIVHMPWPARMPHRRSHGLLAGVLFNYEDATPGVEMADEGTIILGETSEPEPDLQLRLLPEYGGRSRVNEAGYLVGPPELLIEVAHSSESIDLHAKRADYAKAGVVEYLVLLIREGGFRAFDLAANRELETGAEGIYRSKVFPGLWIDPAAAVKSDRRRLISVLRKGLRSPEHRSFVKRLATMPDRSSTRKPRRRK
jgi:Uma2 family endonuclease